MADIPVSIFFAFCALVAGSSAIGQSETDSKADTIIVSGNKLTPEQERSRVQDYIRHTGVTAGQKSVARWIDPVCPKVIGVKSDIAKIFEQKMRVVAELNGVPLASASCQSNIVVAFTRDGGGLVRQIRKRGRSKLSSVKLPDREVLAAGTAPVRWWYAYETRSRDGRRSSNTPLPWAGNAEGGGSALPDVETLSHYDSSIVSTQTVRALTEATIVIDVDKAQGASLDAVAGYAAFVAFAEIEQQVSPPNESILSLFEGGSSSELSTIDSAFLKALYLLPLDRRGRQQRGRLVKDIVSAGSQ